MWETTPATSETDWNYALNYSNNLNLGGHEDWHLSNVNELLSLLNAEEISTASWLNGGAKFSSISVDKYWASTHSYSSGNYYAWVVSLGSGVLSRLGPPHFAKALRWAVRYAGGGAVEILKTGKETRAISEMEEVLKEKPHNMDLWLQLARLSEKKNQIPKAIKAYKRVLELSPEHPEASVAYLRLRLEGVGGD